MMALPCLGAHGGRFYSAQQQMQQRWQSSCLEGFESLGKEHPRWFEGLVGFSVCPRLFR